MEKIKTIRVPNGRVVETNLDGRPQLRKPLGFRDLEILEEK